MRYASVIVALLAVMMLSGCATAPSRKANELKIKELQGRVDQLQSEVGLKDQDIAKLERQLMEREDRPMDTIGQSYQATNDYDEPSSKMTIRQIQNALKKKGFYGGVVDGKMGPKTKEAIKEFQREYGLKPDGVVGAKTRSRLTDYN